MANASEPTEQPLARQQKQRASINDLTVELMLQIADAVAPRRSAHHTSPLEIPRPSDLHGLTISCKGLYALLRPLLFDLDFGLEIGLTEYMHQRGWISAQSKLNTHNSDHPSALVSAIARNDTAAAKCAIAAAQKQSVLQTYTRVAYPLWIPQPYPTPRGSEYQPSILATLDPLSLAVVMGNADVVSLLTEGADFHLLHWEPPRQINKEHCCWHRSSPIWDGAFNVLTPLHMAIYLQKYSVAAVLLTRWCELEGPAELDWHHLDHLCFAALLGDVSMVRLMLDGVEGTPPRSNPWVEKMRSLLQNPHSDLIAYPTVGMSPLASAAQGLGGPEWRGHEIIEFLASRAPHLVKVPELEMYPALPIQYALQMDRVPCGHLWAPGHWIDRPFHLREEGILAFVRIGGLEEGKTLRTAGPWGRQNPFRNTLLSELAKSSDPMAFISKCWDAALVANGGVADDEYWHRAVAGVLKKLRVRIPKSCMQEKKRASFLRKRRPLVELYLNVLVFLESKSPGFVAFGYIFKWLEGLFQEPPNPRKICHGDLQGDWSFLRSRSSSREPKTDEGEPKQPNSGN